MIKVILVSTMAIVLTVVLFIKAITGGVTIHQTQILTNAGIYPFEDYTYKTDMELFFMINHHVYSVPKHFKTDLASIPRWYWSIISPARSDLMESAIVHDYLYQCHTPFTRRQSDDILYSLLRSEGVSEYTAGKMYFAVRIFGSSHFNDLDCENLYGHYEIRISNPAT